MSEEHVERARRASGSLAALFEAFADDIVWDNSSYGGDLPPGWAVTVTGKPAVETMLRRWVGAWDDFRFEISEVIDAGDGVVVTCRDVGRGRGSGLPMRHDYFQWWRFDGDRVTAAAAFREKSAAIRAAGLSG
jgi:ketosteroid isomerase-like protein